MPRYLSCPIIVLAIMSSAMQAQDDVALRPQDMMLFGIVEEERGRAPMGNVRVQVSTDSVPGDSTFTDAMGKYQVFVPLKGVHRVVYGMEGHHRKAVLVDANADMDAAARAREWNIRIDIALMRSDTPLPDDLLDTPIGRAAWRKELGEFKWDEPYTERYKLRLKKALKASGRAGQ